jgi:hypothetical protein
MWCEGGTFEIVEPLLFQYDHGEGTTVTAERYVAMLQNVLLP